MKKAVLLCHGDAVRWRESYSAQIDGRLDVPDFKQLLNVRGKTLVEHTARLLEDRGIKRRFILAAAPTELADQLEVPTVTYTRVPTILHTIHKSARSWGDEQTLLLCGDVLFSGRALDFLLAVEDGIKFLGRPHASAVTGKQHPELFGLTAVRNAHSDLLAAVEKMLEWGEDHGIPVKLWHLFKHLSGFAPTEGTLTSNLMIHINDYTEDIDTVQEFREIWPRVLEAAGAY